MERECVRTSFTGVTAFEKLYAPAYAADGVCSTLAMDNLRDDRASFADPDGTTNVTAEVFEQCATENWPVSECTGGRWVPPQCATADGGPRRVECVRGCGSSGSRERLCRFSCLLRPA